MDEHHNYHMSPDAFRKYGRMVIDFIADYYEQIETYPVLSRVKPGDIRNALPPAPPQKGEDLSQMLEDFRRQIMPGITHWQSPNFFAFFPSNTSGPSILGDLLSAGLGIQGMMWTTSPAATELETHVLDWLAEMLDLPQRFKSTGEGGGVLQDSASSATLVALLAAREKATQYQSNNQGLNRKLTVYTSTQGHSSIEKAVRIAGLGSAQLRHIEVDDAFAMRADSLWAQIRADKQKGLLPAMVAATVGTTSSNAMDPLEAIGDVCQAEDVWLHVDAAMSGTAAICPEFRTMHDGLHQADSYCFNPHKWMFTNFDADCFYVADRRALVQALSIHPEYLKNQASESGEVFDYRDWQIPLGRRFRALKLWFVIRHYGIEGLQHHIRKHVDLARQFARWVQEAADFELAAPVPLNLVTFRHKSGDTVNQKLLQMINDSGKAYLTHTVLDGQYTLRLSVGQAFTEYEHVQNVWRLIEAYAGRLR
ncbi:MAG: aspartate aminotransferase family protein [Caldithrix sp.]|nr:aspartate aminotransferase family protein [Caldithrix sp.]